MLARIPYTLDAYKDEHVQRLNGVIDQLTARNGLRPGPDLYAWFKDHPQELAADGIHPATAGSVSINRLWYEALRARYDPLSYGTTGQTRATPGRPPAPSASASPGRRPAPSAAQPGITSTNLPGAPASNSRKASAA